MRMQQRLENKSEVAIHLVAALDSLRLFVAVVINVVDVAAAFTIVDVAVVIKVVAVGGFNVALVAVQSCVLDMVADYAFAAKVDSTAVVDRVLPQNYKTTPLSMRLMNRPQKHAKNPASAWSKYSCSRWFLLFLLNPGSIAYLRLLLFNLRASHFSNQATKCLHSSSPLKHKLSLIVCSTQNTSSSSRRYVSRSSFVACTSERFLY